VGAGSAVGAPWGGGGGGGAGAGGGGGGGGAAPSELNGPSGGSKSCFEVSAAR
jgi:hypothetical protein